MAVQPLSTKARKRLLQEHSDWTLNKPGTKVSITLPFIQHSQALVFLLRVSVIAETLGHHPDILFTYKKLKITTTTHDISNLSSRDCKLIERIDALRDKLGNNASSDCLT